MVISSLNLLSQCLFYCSHKKRPISVFTFALLGIGQKNSPSSWDQVMMASNSPGNFHCKWLFEAFTCISMSPPGLHLPRLYFQYYNWWPIWNCKWGKWRLMSYILCMLTKNVHNPVATHTLNNLLTSQTLSVDQLIWLCNARQQIISFSFKAFWWLIDL